jgi:hypothetical protein
MDPVVCGYRKYLIPSAVPAPIVDEDNLERARVRLQGLKNPVHQGPNVLILVIERGDH